MFITVFGAEELLMEQEEVVFSFDTVHFVVVLLAIV